MVMLMAALVCCFNPRAREGATRRFSTYVNETRVSIHAPVRARQFNAFKLNRIFYRFNPRAREGATVEQYQGQLINIVSIHAPVRARLPLEGCCSRGIRFQSTRP